MSTSSSIGMTVEDTRACLDDNDSDIEVSGLFPIASTPISIPLVAAQINIQHSMSRSSKTKKPATGLHEVYHYKNYTPSPTVVYIRHEDEANELISTLSPGPIAFDTEWRVFFTRRGSAPSTERRTALVQLADSQGMILVIQVYHMSRFPKALADLIESPSIPKLGVNIANDGRKLFRDYGIMASNLVELGAVAHQADPHGTSMISERENQDDNPTTLGLATSKPRTVARRKMISLAKLTAQYCGRTLSKGNVRTGNWEAVLNQEAIDYAANDVHCAIQIHKHLLSLAEAAQIQLSPSGPNGFTTNLTIHDFACSKSKPKPRSPSLEPQEMRPQHIRAYRMWHLQQLGMDKMCKDLRVVRQPDVGLAGANGMTANDGLKVGTVISYIIGALQADPKLPFDMGRLRELVQMDATSWVRHREWMTAIWIEKNGVV